MDPQLSLTAWILRAQAAHPGARGELSTLLAHVALAARMIGQQVAQAPLMGLHDTPEGTAEHEHELNRLDGVADDLFRKALAHSGRVSVLISEEMEQPEIVHSEWGESRYSVVYDPLDSATNLDVNVTVGTIFGIYRHRPHDRGDPEDLLRPGVEQVAAGYAMYGASTILVICTENSEVHGFTLSPALGEFVLTEPSIRMPAVGRSYSINESRFPHWDEKTQELVRTFRNDEVEGEKRTARYVGSLIADFHRTLMRGGIFMYPRESDKPDGKLGLMYEAAPLALIAERAGGAASDGSERILAKVPRDFHERTPLFIGSRVDVNAALDALGRRYK